MLINFMNLDGVTTFSVSRRICIHWNDLPLAVWLELAGKYLGQLFILWNDSFLVSFNLVVIKRLRYLFSLGQLELYFTRIDSCYTPCIDVSHGWWLLPIIPAFKRSGEKDRVQGHPWLWLASLNYNETHLRKSNIHVFVCHEIIFLKSVFEVIPDFSVLVMFVFCLVFSLVWQRCVPFVFTNDKICLP